MAGRQIIFAKQNNEPENYKYINSKSNHDAKSFKKKKNRKFENGHHVCDSKISFKVNSLSLLTSPFHWAPNRNLKSFETEKSIGLSFPFRFPPLLLTSSFTVFSIDKKT